MEVFDVIVVGGSIAGSSTAMLLARAGLKVLVVERAKFPRDTNSTHFIWPRGVSYLNRWGLADGILEATPHFKDMEVHVEGITLRGHIPKRRLRDRFKSLHGSDDGVTEYYCGPRRYFLDEKLMDAAKAAGADVREQVSCQQVLSEEAADGTRRVTGVRCRTTAGNVFEARAKLVVGADGRKSVLAEAVGSKIRDYRNISTFAYYGYFSDIDLEELHIHKKGRLGTAIFPTLDDTHMVLVYGPTAWWKDFHHAAEENFFRTFDFCAPDVGALVRGGKRIEKFKACGHMPAFQRDLCGPGWVLVGDSGSFKDQVTAMGITHALRDAQLLTDHLAGALDDPSELQSALGRYRRVRKADYEAYFNLVCDTAEMRPYTPADLEQLFALRESQSDVDDFLAQFGDTLPLDVAQQPADEPEERGSSVEWIRRFDASEYPYLYSAS